jgi:chromosome segregation ATPase
VATSSTDSSAPSRHVPDLPVQTADQENDHTSLQQEKADVEEMMGDPRTRLSQKTQSLTGLTTSFDKLPEEKSTMLKEDVAIEERQTHMRKGTAESAREISDMTIKIQEMEVQLQAFEIENAKLQDRLKALKTESHTLQCRIRDLESEKKYGQALGDATEDTRSGSRIRGGRIYSARALGIDEDRRK